MRFSMNHHAQSRDEAFKQIFDLISNEIQQQQKKWLFDLLPYYYANIGTDVLYQRTSSLASALLSHWRLIQRRLLQRQLRVFNPSGQTRCTCIELVTQDQPFLVDSLRMTLVTFGVNVQFMVSLGRVYVRRDDQGQLQAMSLKEIPDALVEAWIYFEIDETKTDCLETIQEKIIQVLEQINLVTQDWSGMRQQMLECIDELNTAKNLPIEEVSEAKAFLYWLLEDHFIYLGCRDYRLNDQRDVLLLIQNSGYGLLRNEEKSSVARPLASLSQEAQKLAFSKQILVISKTNTKSPIHKPVYTDYVGVKRFDQQGRVVGERRFIGLYTSVVYYYCDPRTIPLVRRKIQAVLDASKFSRKSHFSKALVDILLSLPRDDLFQSSSEDLTQLALNMLHIQEQAKVHLFIRPDQYNRFVSCFVFLPKEKLSTDVQVAFGKVLAHAFSGVASDSETLFGDLRLARIHFLIRTDPTQALVYDPSDLEKQLAQIVRSWTDDLASALYQHYTPNKARSLIQKYQHAFHSGYRETFSIQTAMNDIAYVDRISQQHPLEINFHEASDQSSSKLRFKLFYFAKPLILSQVLPVLENLGLKVIDEWPYEITVTDSSTVWMHDFGVEPMQPLEVDITQVKEIVQEAFRKIWEAEVENDGFNRLTLEAQLTWREISILRAYTKYLKQINTPFSQTYIETVLVRNHTIARALVKAFKLRFDPEQQQTLINLPALEQEINTALDGVMSLDEDRILRQLLEVIHATVRTNYFQMDQDGKPKNTLAFKINPSNITDLPLPSPLFEIFVYSPRVEGTHLRAAKVARGGIRWSDRREDFRTEILGLMKAQQVKNAVIVPSGAKGGFVCKNIPDNADRETISQEMEICYRLFIGALLDLTDNLVDGVCVSPKDVLCIDAQDPYLVVAADKGTANLSDVANDVANQYHFWLGDAFASGGSFGYDHKKMGITARGAWISVKNHARLLGLDLNQDDFTVIGIGDMSGDVFGNGMLLSEHIKLVGAFNYSHIFIDPNPDPQQSFQERLRLFNKPRSNWNHYDTRLISEGGGIFKRIQKSIPVSVQMQQLLDLQQTTITPDQLIRALLKARVDLLWNGGIGTYVKASTERNLEVGDRSNDLLRIDGEQLRCRMIAEGGNLGLTQLGRIEYAQHGGLLYTDFIDNSAGVDCSDHEVNFKILLNSAVADGCITIAQRNELLVDMTHEIAQMVLQDNYKQTRIIRLASISSIDELEIYRRYIQDLEQQGLNRALEFIPDDATLSSRKSLGKGLTTPEISILLAYTKIGLKAQLLDSSLLEDIYLSGTFESTFPKALRTERFAPYRQQHSLRREILATKISNELVNDMGVTFIFRVKIATGADTDLIARAYLVARSVANLENFMQLLENLEDTVAFETRYLMMRQVNRLVRRVARWFLQHCRDQLSDIAGVIQRFTDPFAQLHQLIPELLIGQDREDWEQLRKDLISSGVGEDIACQMASLNYEYVSLDVIDISLNQKRSLSSLAHLYFEVGSRFDFGWLRAQIIRQKIDTSWDNLARILLLDDLDAQQRQLTSVILQGFPEDQEDIKVGLEQWQTQQPGFIKRWHQLIDELRSASELKLIMFSVIARELLNLRHVAA
jgi:glutamate dehydrogenase